MPRRDQEIQNFFTSYYGISEGGRTRTHDQGWVCAQRRLGRALGWLHAQYHVSGSDIPDYLFIVDDDTFVDTADVISYLEAEAHGNSGLLMRAGCLFEKNDGSVPFNFPYGGFGLFLNNIALEKMSRQIHCDDGTEDELCSILQRNSIGEMDVFRNGMTLFELFYRFSATKNFCMHSDWLSGYIVEKYLSGSIPKDAADHRNALQGMETFPSCGNTTSNGQVRHCGLDSDTCHNMGEKDIEYFSLASYAKSPLSWKSAPALSGTDWEVSFPKFSQSKRFAYATVLGWSPSSSQNQLYLDAVRVLIRSIKETGTSADIVVLMTYHDRKSESLLLKEHAIVKHVDLIDHSQDIKEFEPWFVDIAFAKLRAFELNEYNRVQFIDADVAVEKSLDDLFEAYPASELVSEGLGLDSPLRAGWMMLQPSQSNFNAMEGILKTGSFDKVHGWNHLDLPLEYPGLVKSGSDWNFYGSSLEQGEILL